MLALEGAYLKGHQAKTAVPVYDRHISAN